MSKKSKQVENRIRSSEHVMNAAMTHKEQIAEALARRAIKAQGTNTVVTKDAILAVVGYLVDDLKQGVVTMNSSELRVVAERADDVGLRETRDTAATNAYTACVRVRSMVLDALGNNSLAKYGLAGETPRLPRDLLSHAQTVVRLMQEQPFNVTVDGVTFDSGAMAATLKTKAEALEKALGDMQREEQELVNELGNRQTAITEWTEVHQGVADALTGLFRLAGRKDLAEWVRPTIRTLSGEEAQADAPATGDGAAATGG